MVDEVIELVPAWQLQQVTIALKKIQYMYSIVRFQWLHLVVVIFMFVKNLLRFLQVNFFLERKGF